MLICASIYLLATGSCSSQGKVPADIVYSYGTVSRIHTYTHIHTHTHARARNVQYIYIYIYIFYLTNTLSGQNRHAATKEANCYIRG